MLNIPLLKRLDVKTPLGGVHLVCFSKAGVNHREVILHILSDVSGKFLSVRSIVQTDEHPKPAVPALDFDVNWTHSGDICVLAYGEPGFRVGVDYEIHKPRRLKIADHFFNPDEVARIRSLTPDAAEREFFRLWCRKEALYKCVGGSFFEGALRRSTLDSKLQLDDGTLAYFCDVSEAVGAVEASLCVAVCQGQTL